MATATATAPAQATRGQLWFRALRAPFLVASVIPVVLGGVLALVYLHTPLVIALVRPGFQSGLFLLTLLGAISVHLATNMLNDNFDFRSGNDSAVKHQNPFAGGGRVLTQRVLNVNTHLAVALGLLALGSLVGLYLVTQVGLTLLWIGLVGVFAALFYVAPPLRLAHRGVGELFVGLSFGPLVVMGTYYVQTQRLDWGPFFLSIAFGLLVAAILWINEFPDVDADLAVGKRTLMARLGYERAEDWYFYLVAGAYVFVPWPALVTLLTVPIARKNVAHLRAHAREPMALIPANAGTIVLTMLFGILAILGVAAGLVL
ncbi:MAG: prenyltransferase [Methanobacteriota archaeon]|nr:MAG: prenyltransferase [Euryarchaeota archaeon]